MMLVLVREKRVKSRRSKTGSVGLCAATSPWATTDTSRKHRRYKIYMSASVPLLDNRIGIQRMHTHTMATRTPALRYFARATSGRLVTGLSRRQFTACATRSTDGVFRALTENRVRTPWVEALRKQKEDGTDPTKASGKPETPSDRDLSPRSMSDSYHSVV
jgi:hypothetical protein